MGIITVEGAKAAIIDAFPIEPIPDPAELYPLNNDSDSHRDCVAGKKWTDPAVFQYSRTEVSFRLGYLWPQAFSYYLAAYLMRAVENPAFDEMPDGYEMTEGYEIRIALLGCLYPPTDKIEGKKTSLPYSEGHHNDFAAKTDELTEAKRYAVAYVFALIDLRVDDSWDDDETPTASSWEYNKDIDWQYMRGTGWGYDENGEWTFVPKIGGDHNFGGALARYWKQYLP